MRINFDFNDLEVFLAVKDSGSFHVAAQRLNLSQSAVTRRIQKLETALESTLFERTTRAVKPTLAAKRLQARAQAILDDAQEATLAMRDESVSLSHQRNAVVTVAIIPSIIAPLMPAAIGIFRAGAHAARIRLLDFAANEVAEAVTGGEADFGVCSIPTLEPTTRFEPLFDDRIVLAMPYDHPLSGQKTLHWSDLGSENLIVPARGTGNRLLIDEAMGRARLPLHWTYEVSRSTTALTLVAQRIGTALLPQSAVPTGTNIISRPMAAPEIARPIGLITRLGQTDSAAVSALKQAIRAAVRPVNQGGDRTGDQPL